MVVSYMERWSSCMSRAAQCVFIFRGLSLVHHHWPAAGVEGVSPVGAAGQWAVAEAPWEPRVLLAF